MDEEFAPYDIEWTPAASRRFWDYFSENPRAEDTYFSRHHGEALLRLVKSQGINLHAGPVLDFGCGPGYFLEKLARLGIPCYGLDFSPRSIQQVEENLVNEDCFMGVQSIGTLPLPFPRDHFQTVFLLEIIEHLLDEELDGALAEVHRVTKEGGFVIITTPNDEDLDASQVMCPDCGCVFHQMQHVRSWTLQTLVNTCERFGFTTVFCKGVFLPRKTLASRLRAWGTRVLRMKMPNLVYIGLKQRNGSTA